MTMCFTELTDPCISSSVKKCNGSVADIQLNHVFCSLENRYQALRYMQDV